MLGGSAACVASNSLTLDKIGFTDLAYTTITPVRVTGPIPALKSAPPDPGEVFAETFFHMPGRVYFGKGSSATSYAGSIDASWAFLLVKMNSLESVIDGGIEELRKARSELILDALISWGDDNRHGDQTVGIHNDTDYLWVGMSDGGYKLLDDAESYGVFSAKATMTVVHELFHGAGRRHADTACGGDSDGQTGESWPPDQRGRDPRLRPRPANAAARFHAGSARPLSRNRPGRSDHEGGTEPARMG